MPRFGGLMWHRAFPPVSVNPKRQIVPDPAGEVAYTIGLEHNLVMYAELPANTYSDMNGYGHYVKPLFWFNLYWVLVAGILVMTSVFFWVRGTDVRGMMRWREARRRT